MKCIGVQEWETRLFCLEYTETLKEKEKEESLSKTTRNKEEFIQGWDRDTEM